MLFVIIYVRKKRKALSLRICADLSGNIPSIAANYTKAADI